MRHFLITSGGEGANIFYGCRQKEKGRERGQAHRPLQEKSSQYRASSGIARPTAL